MLSLLPHAPLPYLLLFHNGKDYYINVPIYIYIYRREKDASHIYIYIYTNHLQMSPSITNGKSTIEVATLSL